MIQGPSCHSNGIRGYGNIDDGVMLLGISPASVEMITGKPMIGPSGRLMDNILKACGWHRDKCYATNIVCYENREPSLEQIMTCRPRLKLEVETFKPKLIVLMGEKVGSLFFPTRKYGTVRGIIDYYAPWQTYVLPTYHVASILHANNEHVTRSIVRDFLKINEFFDYPPQPEVEFRVVTSIISAQAILDKIGRQQPQFVTLDVETHLDKDMPENVPIEQQIAYFSITAAGCTYCFPGVMISILKWPNVNWTFQGGMFDTVALAEAIGVMLDIKHDTMYMSYSLDERKGTHGLKHLSRESDAVGFYEEHPTLKKWEDKLKDVAWITEYNSKDSAYTERQAKRLWRRVCAEEVVPFDRGYEPGTIKDVYEKYLIPGANTYRLMQQTGIPVDRLKYRELLREYVPMRDEIEASVKASVVELGGPENINLASPKQLGAFLFGTLRLPGGPSTAAEILETLVDEHPFVNRLIDLRHIEKALGTYLVGIYDDLRKTGRIHPNPGLHSQATGRISYTPYAINTTPRETNDNPYLSRIKEIFVAPEDYVFLVLDYVQAEIWAAQFYSQDPNMLIDLRSGDFHTRSACNVFGITPEQMTSEKRSSSKKVTFGQFFGIGDNKLAHDMTHENAKLGLPARYTRADAQALQANWILRYEKYADYKANIIREVQQTGELTSISGRKRRFPVAIDLSWLNQGINCKIQTTSHDNLMLSIIEAYDMNRSMGAYPLFDGHDAVAILARKDNYQDVAKYNIEVMQRPKWPGYHAVPCEAKIGTSLATLEKIKL